MRKGAYPDLEPHIAQHRAFMAKAEDLRAQAAAGSATLDVALLEFLKDWLINHIMQQDKAFESFLPQEQQWVLNEDGTIQAGEGDGETSVINRRLHHTV